MPCKIRRGNHGETCSSSGIHKTKYACILEADESTRKRLEGTLHKDHEDHIAGKGINSLSHYHLVHKFIPMPEAIKIPEAKQQWRKNVEKLEAKTTPTLKPWFRRLQQALRRRRVRVHRNCPGILKAPSQCLSLVACAENPEAEDSNQK